jgi:hypothetical protein
MKISLIVNRLFHRRRINADARERMQSCDPLDHPAIRRMSLRELADLPFNRTCRDNCK